MRPHTSALLARDLVHAYGDRRILDGLSLVVPPGERVGLIGENGVGKSTLLRLLAGVEEPDAGTIERPPRIGRLDQEVRADADTTLGDLIERAVAPLRALEADLAAAAGALSGRVSQPQRLDPTATGPDAAPHPEKRAASEEGSAARVSQVESRDPAPSATDGTAEPEKRAADRYDELLAEAERRELWSLDARRDELLAGLGVGALPLDRRVSEVSGGQRSRVALAALLLSGPDALLLDEPTNHLDDAAVAFLAARLRRVRGPVLFASHDRAFLDEVATSLLDLDPSRSGATRYGGGYSDYLAAKTAERARWEQQHALDDREQVRLEHAVAVTARTVGHDRAPRDNDKFLRDFKRNRIGLRIAARIRAAEGRLDDHLERRVDEPPPVLSFAGIPTGSQPLEGDEPLILLRDLSVPGRLELDDLRIDPDARLLVTGPNGAGKSTLLGALAGTIADAGAIRRRKGLRIGLLGQDVRWSDPTVTPRMLWARVRGERRAEERPLADLGLLAPADLDRPVGRLSIGQQRRTALALTIATPPHLFLLDEPTNHLSLALATELEEALGTYPGAVVIASHDRWLRRRWSGPELSLAASD